MKPNWKRRGAVLLADAVLLFLGLYGVTASFLTAFRLAPDAAGLGFACLPLAGLACLVFSVRKLWCRLALYLGWFALLTGWARAALDKLILGALLAAQQVGTVCAEQLPGIPPPDLAHYVQALTAAEQTEYLTLLFCAILGVLAFLLGWAVVYRRSFWCALLLTAPILTVPLVFTLAPRWSALAALLLFWGAGLLTRLPRKKDPYGTAKLTLLVLPPLLLALAVLGSLLPRNGYRQPPKVEALRMEITRRVYETGRELAAGQLSGTTLMGGGGTEADLAQAGPLNFTGRAALRVESEKTGHIYLRGCSAGIYENSKWLQIPAEAYPQMEYQPMNFPALQDVQASPQHGTTRVVVENVGAAGAYVYTPYQLLTTPERMGGAEFVTDAYLARGDGIWRHILYARDEAKPGDALYGGAGEAERTYAQFVREQYLQVPRALQNKLPPEPLRGAFEQDPLAAAQAVAEWLAELAVYDPQTPATPSGEDFVAHFLTEKRGYCMHFATAATLMLRDMGIPARYVTGYVADTVAGKTVTVPDYNAHAWVEVYCDGFGWQPVEVTPGFSGEFPWTAAEAEPAPTQTPKPSAAPAPLPTKVVQAPTDPADPDALPRWAVWVPLCLLALLGGAVLRRRLAQRSRRRSAAAADRNRAVIDLYLYAQKLLRWTGAGVDGEMLALAQRAKFSQHRLTEDQRMQMVTYAKNLRQATKNRLTWYKKLAFEYIFGL